VPEIKLSMKSDCRNSDQKWVAIVHITTYRASPLAVKLHVKPVKCQPMMHDDSHGTERERTRLIVTYCPVADTWDFMKFLVLVTHMQRQVAMLLYVCWYSKCNSTTLVSSVGALEGGGGVCQWLSACRHGSITNKQSVIC
jgi:hypothetical protein